ncbi:MAG: PhnD/SsuA/transferrin family substrate-binding protein [Pseudomonadota bacterium]
MKGKEPPMPLAALPMYDWPEVRAETDALWRHMADHLNAAGFPAPDNLTRSADLHGLWTSPDLLVAQTCGLPLVTTLRGQTVPLVTPHYAVPGCAGGTYSSAILVRADHPAADIAELYGACAAINGWDSQSGMAALRRTVARHARDGRFFRTVVVTGSHRESIRAVADGRADCCAMDAVSYDLAQRFEAAAVAGTRLLGFSPAAPALPFITSAARPNAEQHAMAEALLAALRCVPKQLAEMLRIADASPADTKAYEHLAEWAEADGRAGYATLADGAAISDA